MEKTYSRDIEKAANVRRTARITDTSIRYVNMVIEGERRNEVVLDTYMLFQEGNEALLAEARERVRSIRKHSHA